MLSSELISNKVEKKDIEGFLSSFLYNKSGAANVSKIAELVFEEDPHKLSQHFYTQNRANPPLEATNDDLTGVRNS